MEAQLQIKALSDLPAGVEALRAEAVGEGFRFMDRLTTEWHANKNKFDQPGEVLLGAYRNGDLVAVGGLNRDPYTVQGRVGRLRHIYVLRAARRHGVASALVGRLLKQAEGVFDVVRLRTETQEGAMFYARHGFDQVEDKTASHIIRFGSPSG